VHGVRVDSCRCCFQMDFVVEIGGGLAEAY
jgi:hypothetical protein